ncbi:hypothetical protein MKW94_026694, partial [Papaver nudicaule]|nr:hypothetical protein [Papaver nudicaule]
SLFTHVNLIIYRLLTSIIIRVRIMCYARRFPWLRSVTYFIPNFLNQSSRKDIDTKLRIQKAKIDQLHALSEKFERSGENVHALTEVNDMRKNLEEKDYELDSLINLNNALISREYISNHELQEARNVLIMGLDGFASIHSHPVIGIKRMGELNEKPFRDICTKKFLTEEWETKYVELCSLWQKNVQDSEWYPYNNVTIDKELH